MVVAGDPSFTLSIKLPLNCNVNTTENELDHLPFSVDRESQWSRQPGMIQHTRELVGSRYW